MDDLDTGHRFYTTSSFVHRFKAMGEFKLELQSVYDQFGSKLATFVPCILEIWWMILKNNRYLYHVKLCAYTTSSFVHRFKVIGKLKLELQSRNTQFGSKTTIFVLCDLEILRMTLKNNMAPLLCCFKLCASFRSHWEIQTRVTVWKRQIWFKIDIFLPCEIEMWR